MKNKKEGEGIKIFLAEKKPVPVKVFQFTKEMLPEVDKEKLKISIYKEKCKFHPNIIFLISKIEIHCFLFNKLSPNLKFRVGDYIGEQEGNYFVIKKEEFDRDWVAVK